MELFVYIDEDNLKTIRKSKGLSQKQMGIICGVNQSTISRVESGEIKSFSPDSIIQIKFHFSQMGFIQLSLFPNIQRTMVFIDGIGFCKSSHSIIHIHEKFEKCKRANIFNDQFALTPKEREKD